MSDHVSERYIHCLCIECAGDVHGGKGNLASQASVSPLIIAAVFYYVFNFIVAFVMERIEKKMDYYR